MPVCRYCRAPIVWKKTRNDNGIPLDPEPRDDGNVVLRPMPGTMGTGEKIAHVLGDGEAPVEGELRYRAHFVACPKAEAARKRHVKTRG